jgi:hypothetical protein
VGTVAQKRAPQFFTSRDIPPRFGCLFYANLDGLTDRFRVFSFLPLSDDSFIYAPASVTSKGGARFDKIILPS